jgi:hypothetical protein
MIHCGVNYWKELMEKRGMVDYRYLTSISKTADLQISYTQNLNPIVGIHEDLNK